MLLTRRERDPSTAVSCTTAPGTRHSRGSASTVAYAGSSPGREAYSDLKKQGTNRLAAVEHQLLQLVVHVAAVTVRQPSGSLPLSTPRGVAVVERPWRRPIAVSLPTSPAHCRLRAVLSRSLSPPRRPIAVCRRSLDADALCLVRPGVGLQPTP